MTCALSLTCHLEGYHILLNNGFILQTLDEHRIVGECVERQSGCAQGDELDKKYFTEVKCPQNELPAGMPIVPMNVA